MSDQQILLPGAVAAADLSAEQYAGVYLTGDRSVAKITDSNAAAFAQAGIGILQNDPNAAGKAAEVVMVGICRAECGGTVAQGAYLVLNNDGEVISGALEADKASADRAVIGRALAAGADGDIIDIAVNFITPLPHDTE
jgi:hypothetical protein|tara:strand:+ start:452 stop:868 length:417 start_codon:yes stop_codon:yes gene_type:complete